jgi:BirA family biotin operon repressor/biotin-[acetyl-CoA-carboxylase] ligase
LADFQTGGRGQGHNRWQSEPGKNLLFSIILRPVTVPAEKQFYLSMAVATGMAAGLREAGAKAMVKWPNDILVGGKKLAGILIENTIMADALHTSVAGIGLNVNQAHFTEDIPAATSLLLQTGSEHEILKLLDSLLSAIGIRIAMLYDADYGRIKSDYLNLLWKLNTRAEMKDAAGTFTGRIVDIAESGELLVAGEDGNLRRYGFREVGFGD